MTIPDSNSTLAESALQYARESWPIFPLRPGRKEPLRGTNGVKDATASTASVIDWWTGNDGYNIGYGIPDGVVVMDIDPRNGGLKAILDLQDAHDWLEPTLCAVSGRGDGGLHYYYQAPDVPLVGNLSNAGFDGIDFKKEGGYVLLPPSTHPDTGRPYRWVDETCPMIPMPAWLVELAARPAAPEPTVAPGVASGDVVAMLDAPNPSRWNGDGLVVTMREAREGERNNMLNWVLWQMRDDMAAGKVSEHDFNACLVLVIDAAQQAGLDEREVQSTIRSVFRTGRST